MTARINSATKQAIEPRLTPREIQVLRLLCEPCSTKEAAARLGISFKTAVSHRTNIMAKAGTHDPISLFRWGIREGYVPPQIANDGDTAEEEFGYRCISCHPKPGDARAPVHVIMRCPRHGLCWHARFANRASQTSAR